MTSPYRIPNNQVNFLQAQVAQQHEDQSKAQDQIKKCKGILQHLSNATYTFQIT